MNLLKRIFSLRTLGRFLFVCASLVTLLVLLLVEENWRAKRAWQNYHREHIARGEVLDLQQIIPPPVPDDRNFAMTPLLKPLFEEGNTSYVAELSTKVDLPRTKDKKVPSLGDRVTGRRFNPAEWQAYLNGQDALSWLQKLDPELREIAGALRQPYSRFPIAYEKGFAASLPHISILMKLAKLYGLRACAELHQGQIDAALEDIQTTIRLGNCVENEPFLISLLVRIAIYQPSLQVVWGGLEDHRWTEKQLAGLQETLAGIDLVKGLSLAMHGERAGSNNILLSVIDKPEILSTMLSMSVQPQNPSWRLFPSGLIYRNMLAINRIHDQYYTFSADPASHRIDPAAFQNAEKDILEKTFLSTRIPIPNPSTILARLVLPVFMSIGSKTGYTQTSIDEAVIACALERYRLENGEYPSTLGDLTPKYLPKPPRDLITGGELHYRRDDSGTYLLYSTGWDGKDDGGKAGLKENGSVDVMKGDWVWSVKAAPTPAPKPAG